jgi:hypothetical protein
MNHLIHNHRALLGIALAIALAVVVVLIVVYSGGGQSNPY